MTSTEYKCRHDLLMQEWIKKSNAGNGLSPFAIDGIMDPDNWFSKDNREERILFVLKEAYDSGRNIPPYVDRSSVPEDSPYPRLWSLTDYLFGRECTELCSKKSLEMCLNCRSFKGTYGNCVSWAYAIQLDSIEPSYSHFKSFCKNSDSGRTELLRKVAVINIKKANGKVKSNDNELASYVQEDREKLLEQLELIDPTLIICGGTWKYFKCLFPNAQSLTPCINHPEDTRFGHVIFNQRKIISMPHPSNFRWYTAETMYLDVIANYRALIRADNSPEENYN